MEKVKKKSTRYITAIVITTVHKSSPTWKQFKKGIGTISAILVTRVHGVIREVNAAAIHRFEQDSRCADLV